MTIRQVAGYLQLNEKTIYRMIKSGKIPCFRISGSWRFKKSAVETWIDSLNTFTGTPGAAPARRRTVKMRKT
ncbi:MAG: helix-turn-helix domain-containing protein [bacterium]